jgi:hypothetical protein
MRPVLFTKNFQFRTAVLCAACLGFVIGYRLRCAEAFKRKPLCIDALASQVRYHRLGTVP